MTPQSVGRDDSRIVLGRHSGMHGYSSRLDDLGITLTKEEVESTYQRFLEVADRKKEVFDEDIFAIVGDELGHRLTSVNLDYFRIVSGNTEVPTATVRIANGDQTAEASSPGDGPVDAIFKAIDKALRVKAVLKEYVVHAVTPGKQAMGEVSVVIRVEDGEYKGTGSSTDILEASARAYASAVASYLKQQETQS
jgi:2-isopropylmalate synthase